MRIGDVVVLLIMVLRKIGDVVVSAGILFLFVFVAVTLSNRTLSTFTMVTTQ